MRDQRSRFYWENDDKSVTLDAWVSNVRRRKSLLPWALRLAINLLLSERPPGGLGQVARYSHYCPFGDSWYV